MRARAILVVLLVAAGCGRVGYDAVGDDDDAAVTPDGSGLVRETWTFGEAPGTTVSGVTADTMMCDGGAAASRNWGAFGRIEGGDSCTGLVRFDLTGLPAGSVTIEASVALWPELVPNVVGQVDVHRVTEAWDEGTLEGSDGVANYDQRQPGLAWSNRGAQPPGSSDPTPLHTFHPGVFEAQVIPLPPAVVDDWIADPSSNHGIGLFGSGYGSSDQGHPHFLSSDNSETAQRPVMTITFDHP